VIVDNDRTLNHRYSLDGVTEVMERRASSPVHSERARPQMHPKSENTGSAFTRVQVRSPGGCDVRVRLLQLVD